MAECSHRDGNMLRIGDFSKLTWVTIKTLRYYDRIGLLRPAWIDRYTGYRYYSLDQLPRINRILALKDLGFSLEQIASMIDQQLSVAQMRQVMEQRQKELQQRITQETLRLSQVEARLIQMEQEGSLPTDVVLRSFQERKLLLARSVVSNLDDLELAGAEMRRKLSDWFTQVGLRMTGPWIFYRSTAEYSERSAAIEIGRQTLSEAKDLPAWVIARQLPNMPSVACVSQNNALGDSRFAYTSLYRWMELNAYQASGVSMELMLESDPDAGCRVYEVQVPVEKLTFKRHFSIDSFEKESEMEPEIVTKPAFMVVGMKYFGKNQNQEISQMWGQFNPRVGEIKQINMDVAYGVCSPMEPENDGAFEYVAGFEVRAVDQLPEGMVARMVPEQMYAVFPHRGGLEGLHDTYNYAYQAWLPQSEYKAAHASDLEVYGKEFDITSDQSVMYIYIPIEKK